MSEPRTSELIAGDGPDEGDEPVDPDLVQRGVWLPGPYGAGDELGSLREVTPEKTAWALSRLDCTAPIQTYSLGELLRPGFPAYADRRYEQQLVVKGFAPSADFDGICSTTKPAGRNNASSVEERVSFTYNMGSKINGLLHMGAGDLFYNGFRGSDVVRGWGTTALASSAAPPIVTRGVLLDVLGAKAVTGSDADIVLAANGNPMLRADYRVTVEDLLLAQEYAELTHPLEPGDVVLIRTGWRQLIATDPVRYVQGRPPGPFLRECRYLAARRPAIIGSDTWCFELNSPPALEGYSGVCKQELFMRFGIRVGEGIPTDDLADDSVYDFVFCFNPRNAVGAVSSNAPAIALGQPRKRPWQHPQSAS
jgi:hypothetical protein